MIHFTTPKHHWNYYKAIERDLEKISRYIEFCNANLDTYSIELTHILLSASSEVDVIMKQLCDLLVPNGTYENINNYKDVITAQLPSFINEEMQIPRYGIKYSPWENWAGTDNPDWWRSHNRVKHQRHAYYPEANLKNTINAVGALLITNAYYYQQVFSREAGYNIEFRDTIKQLDSSINAFLYLNEAYYYRFLTE